MRIREAAKVNFDLQQRHPYELARAQWLKQFIQSQSTIPELGRLGIVYLAGGDMFMPSFLVRNLAGVRICAVEEEAGFLLHHAWNMRFGSEKSALNSYESVEEAIESGASTARLVICDSLMASSASTKEAEDLLTRIASLFTEADLLLVEPLNPDMLSAYDQSIGLVRRYDIASLKVGFSRLLPQFVLKAKRFYASSFLMKTLVTEMEASNDIYTYNGLLSYGGDVKGKTADLLSDAKRLQWLEKVGITLWAREGAFWFKRKVGN